MEKEFPSKDPNESSFNCDSEGTKGVGHNKTQMYPNTNNYLSLI